MSDDVVQDDVDQDDADRGRRPATGGAGRMAAGVCGVLLVVPMLAVTGGCAATTDCHAAWSSTGPVVRAGTVVDTLHVWCSPTPATHSVTARLLYRAVGDYAPLGRATFTDRRPDPGGFDVPVSAVCVAGWYQASASVRAVNASGQTSTATVVGAERRVSAAECGGSR